MVDLYPFQIEGATWLASRKLALLADHMGLGKSAQAIHAADLINAGRICVVCPSVAKVNWGREFEKFSKTTRDFQLVKSQSEIIDPRRHTIISYDLLVSNLFGLDSAYDLLILDEVHFVKSVDTKRVRAVFGRSGIVRRAVRVWALSATPAPNDVSELWGLLYTFGATPLLHDAFIDRYCLTADTNYGRRVVGNKPETLPELRATLDKIMLRRKKEEVMQQLPPISFNTLTVEPGEVDFGNHDSLCLFAYPKDRRDEVFTEIAKQEKLVADTFKVMDTAHPLNHADPSNVMAVLEGLAKSVSTLRRYNGLQKCGPAIDLVTKELEAKAYSKIVIFCVHTDVVDWLRHNLKKFNPVVVYGGTTPVKRQRNIDAFQNNPTVHVMLANIHAAGTAITLTAANQVLFVEQDWVPGNNAQAAMRCHRIGQTRPVFVRFLSLGRGTIDGRISLMCSNKARNLLEAGL